MRLKDPFSLKAADMTKRTNKPRKPRDEESSDEVSGLTCQHVNKAVDLSSVKKSVLSSVWLVCTECLRERTMIDGEPAACHDILVCLKCGFQGCNQSGIQHAVKHHQTFHPESHYITISLNTWKAWCFECNEELSTHCNKKALAQTLDFLQKHSAKATSAASPKIIKLREEPSDYAEAQRGKNPAINSTLVPVKGIINLGNTCFFNAVMQNLSQTHMLIDLIQEVKEKGYKLKICLPVETNLSQLTVALSSPDPLTAAMIHFLQSMKESGKGPVNPKVLFNQLCQKYAPRFKGYQQQDSQELLHYLLDSIRVEETKRVKAAILKAFNNPTEKTADEETKRQVKAYGKEGVKMTFVDRIFVGELTNTIMCEECEHISTVKEAFIDISLPIIEERISKPSNPGRLGKGSREQDSHAAHSEQVLSAAHSVNKNSRKLSGPKQLIRRPSSSVEEKGAACCAERAEEEAIAGGSARGVSVCKMTAAGSLSDGSERDSGAQDSSNDADSEASESEWAPRGGASGHSHASTPSSTSTLTPSPTPVSSSCPVSSSASAKQGGAVEQLVTAVSKVNLGFSSSPGDTPASGHCAPEELVDVQSRDQLHHYHHQGAFQALSHSYTPTSKECSIQSCLHQFTSVELLMGNNKLLCENCTERRQKQLRKSAAADKKMEKIYTSARKQMLISLLPPVITLHLKRFHQAGMNLRKVNRHVDFPLILDLAPFCSASCKVTSYFHSSKIHLLLRRMDLITFKKYNRAKEAGGSSQGQWVYVSDTTVQTVPESRVLSSQAYLLFYEEML
uniref:Ubiquitin carboxyl-terminal hydrolase 45 n=1 Tax=Xiphophorus couchianus TaxID=32473 RepID=A0A3B5MTB3_9TELE